MSHRLLSLVARSPRAWICAGLAASVLALYAPSLGFAFLDFDDDLYVSKNPTVARGLSASGLVWAFTSIHHHNWHPLTSISYLVDVSLFGTWAGGFHAVNVLLHALNAALLFLALDALSKARLPSAFAAALFALHPLRVESVAWVSERKDVLSGAFFLLTLLAYAAYVKRPTLARHARIALALAAGLLSKPMLVTTPFVLLLLDYWPLRRLVSGDGGAGGAAVFWSRVREKLPLFALAFASSAITFWVQREGAVHSTDVISIPWRLANSATALGAYLWQSLWPAALAPFYPHPSLVTSQGVESYLASALSAAALVGVLLLLAVRARERRPYCVVGALWALGMLVPVIGLVQVGQQAHADRYSYLPSIGLALIVAWALADLVRARPRWRVPVAVASALVLVALGTASARQLRYWRDGETLFRHAVEAVPRNYAMYNNLGVALVAQNRIQEAAREYEASLQIRPTADAFNNLGVVQQRQRRFALASQSYRRALALEPDRVDALANLGALLAESGQLDAAVEHLERARELAPDHYAVRKNLGIVYVHQQRPEQGLAELRAALRIDPGDLDLRNDIGLVLAQLGRRDEAAAEFEAVLRADPRHAGARANLWRVRASGPGRPGS